MAEYLLPKLKKIFTESADNPFVFLLPDKKAFKTINLAQLQLQAEEARPHFIIKAPATTGSYYTIHCRVNAGGIEYDLGDNESNSPLFFLYNHQVFLWKSNDVIHLVDKCLPEGKMNVPANEWGKTLSQFILPPVVL